MLYLHKPAKYHSLNKQRGVVIVVALFIVALVAAISYVVLARLSRDTVRTTLILRNIEAENIAQGSIAWAMNELSENWQRHIQNPNARVDKMPLFSPIQTVNGYKVNSIIYDMQMRFNLNSVTTPEAQASFKRLILAVYPEFTEGKAQEVILALNDWFSPKREGQNEFDRYYLERVPPYRPAHQPMLSPSELRLVKGVTPALFNALQPYITALPPKVLFNIVTAPPQVLMTLAPNLSFSTAKTLQELFSQAANVTKEAFSNMDVVRNNQLNLDNVAFISNYFLVETTVAIEDQVLLLYTLLERGEKDKKTIVRVVWQSKGTW
jgi:general secretion pathway protein K